MAQPNWSQPGRAPIQLRLRTKDLVGGLRPSEQRVTSAARRARHPRTPSRYPPPRRLDAPRARRRYEMYTLSIVLSHPMSIEAAEALAAVLPG